MKDIFNNMTFLEGYRVFCFSDVHINNTEKDNTVVNYKVGDIIPTCSYSYMYGSNLMILDGVNNKIHVIYNSKYSEIVSVNNGTISVPEISVFNMFLNYVDYNTIDIYGNFLDIDDINEIMIYFLLFETLNVEMVHNSFVKQPKDKDNVFLITNNLHKSYRNSSLAISESNIDIKTLEDTLQIRSIIKESLRSNMETLNMSIDDYIIEDSILNKINFLLLNISLLYKVVNKDIKKPFTYYYRDKKEFSHAGRVYDNIKDFIEMYSEEELAEIIDIIFSSTTYPEEYEDFIISSISMDNLI